MGKVAQLCLTLCNPMDFMEFLGQNTGMCSLSLLQGIFPTQRSNRGLPHCKWIFLPAEPEGKPEITRVGSLSLLQQIFLTQKSNWGLLHCRRILYQLSHRDPRQMVVKKIRQIIIEIMEYVYTSISIYTHKHSQNSPTEIKYSRLTWWTKNIKNYIYQFQLRRLTKTQTGKQN